MHTCPECLENEVPAAHMNCLDCCDILVAHWVTERDAPAVKTAAEIKFCPGVYVEKNLLRCNKRADQSGICKRHRQLIALGQATVA